VPCAERAAEHRGREPDGSQARNQEPIVAADLHACDGFPRRAEAARDERTVDVREFVRERNAGRLFGEHVRCVTAVALPAVRRTKLARARNHVAGLAILADAAAADVIDNDPMADSELLAAGTRLDDPAARFVTRNDVAIRFVADAEMLAIDRADVAAADTRSLNLDEDLAMAWRRHGCLAKRDGRVTG